MRRILLALSLLLAPLATHAHGPVATGFSGGGGGGGSGSSTPAGFMPGGLANQQCRASDGVCPDPNGAIVIDPFIAGWAAAPGGIYDADGSNLYDFTGRVVNAQTDPIFTPYTAVTITVGAASGATLVNLTGTAQPGSDAADTYFCRCSGSPYETASDSGAACTSGTSTSVSTVQRPTPIIFRDTSADVYWMNAVSTNYHGCNTGASSALDIIGSFPFAVESGDQFQPVSSDGVHPTEFYSRWLAQRILTATWEEVYWPKVNLLGNEELGGSGSPTDAALGEVTTGWTKTNVTTGTAPSAAMTSEAYDPTVQLSSIRGIRGKAIVLSYSGRLAGDGIATPAAAVLAGRTYVFRGSGRFYTPNTGRSDTSILKVQPATLSGAGSATVTPLATTEYNTYLINGYNPKGLKLVDGAMYHEECTMHCQFVVVVTPAASGNIVINIAGMVGSNNFLMADEWVGFESIYSGINTLHYVFPEVGNQRWMIAGDSRGQESRGGIEHGFEYMLNTVTSPLRPALKWATGPLAGASESVNSRQICALDGSLNSLLGVGSLCTTTGVAAPGFATGYRKDPQFTVLRMGVNDRRSSIGYTDDLLAEAVSTIKGAGSIPVIILEEPFNGNTSWLHCTGGTTNCSLDFNNAARDFLHDGGAN